MEPLSIRKVMRACHVFFSDINSLGFDRVCNTARVRPFGLDVVLQARDPRRQTGPKDPPHPLWVPSGAAIISTTLSL